MQTEALMPTRMEPPIERARKVIADHALISLSKKGQLALVSVLDNQPKPTKAMKDLMGLPDFPGRDA